MIEYSLMEIVIATNNPDKVREIMEIYKELSTRRPCQDRLEFFTLKDKGLICDVTEDGKTFLDNAELKARAVAMQTGISVLADDSGICVDVLNGGPGIFSNRYAEENNSPKNRKKLLKTLEELGKKSDFERKAHFECAMVLISPQGIFRATGKSDGRILAEEMGNNGFGYDCIFFSDDLQKCWGLASDIEKNRVSHRARALENLLKAIGVY